MILKKRSLFIDKNYSISTCNNLDYRYIKNDKQIIFGIRKPGSSPTLIYPWPKWIFTDVQLNRMIYLGQFENILDRINGGGQYL